MNIPFKLSILSAASHIDHDMFSCWWYYPRTIRQSSSEMHAAQCTYANKHTRAQPTNGFWKRLRHLWVARVVFNALSANDRMCVCSRKMKMTKLERQRAKQTNNPLHVLICRIVHHAPHWINIFSFGYLHHLDRCISTLIGMKFGF